MVVELQVKPRDKKTKAKALRRQGVIPATLYGPEIEATNLQLSAKDFSHVPYEDYNHLIHLKEEGKEDTEALIKEIQRDFVSNEVQNIEFYKVKRGQKVSLKVALKFKGNSEAVKMGADLAIVHHEAHVKCLPRHIPSSIEVNLEKLAEAEDAITFDDLEINREEIEIVDPGNEVICKAETKRKDHMLALEEEAKAAEEAAAAEGEAAEGEAAPAEGGEAKAEGGEDKKEEAKPE